MKIHNADVKNYLKKYTVYKIYRMRIQLLFCIITSLQFMRTTKLSNGIEIPTVGFGVYQIKDYEQCKQNVLEALQAGYRHIDTAAAYLNEEAVGAAIKESGIPREEIFITTKIWVQDFGYENTLKAFETCRKNLGVDYIDLVLLHQPFNDYYGSWRALEEIYESKKAHSIGVSNFYPDRLVDLCLNCRIKPQVNQVELHPFFQQEEAIKIGKEYGIQYEAWGPLAEAGQGILENETLKNIANKYHKTVAQVCLRWNIQRGIVILPKSTHKNRMEENINIFDFELSEEDMANIRKLNTDKSKICDHTSPAFVKFIHDFKIHE